MIIIIIMVGVVLLTLAFVLFGPLLNEKLTASSWTPAPGRILQRIPNFRTDEAAIKFGESVALREWTDQQHKDGASVDWQLVDEADFNYDGWAEIHVNGSLEPIARMPIHAVTREDFNGERGF